MADEFRVPRVRLGQTDLELPLVSFGASPLGSVFKEVSQDEANAAVATALSLGIDYFDTSPYYGGGKSEAALGAALAASGQDRKSYMLGSKAGRNTDGTFDFSPANIEASVTESLRRLGTDHLDTLLLHDVEFGLGPFEGDVPPKKLHELLERTMPTLLKLRDARQVRAVGYSGYPLSLFTPPQAPQAPLPPHGIDYILSYCHNNLHNRSAGLCLDTLAARGIGVIVASPLSMGLLSPSGPPPWHPAPPVLAAAASEARKAVADEGGNIAEVALGWSLERGRERGVSTLVGMCSEDEVRANFETTRRICVGGGVDRKMVQVAESKLWPVFGETWKSP
jgi:L-galactose dehydrogenase